MSEEIIMKLPLLILVITTLYLCFGWYIVPLIAVLWVVSRALARSEE